MEKSILKKFMRYVSLNVLGMIGISCYILADTFFVSKALGAMVIAALNFSIPVYNVIHGTGLIYTDLKMRVRNARNSDFYWKL